MPARLIRFKATRSIFFAIPALALVALSAIPPAMAAQPADQTAEADRSPLVPVTLYLQWYHQFQFAGYYAALEQGYYRDAGLDVSIIEGGPGVETFQKVGSAPGRYGTAHAAGALLNRARGEPVVVLAAVFQHSPNVIIARADSGITTPHDLPGTRTVIWPGGHIEHSAMLLNEGIDPTPFQHDAQGDNVKDLIEGKIDAIDGYITNEVFSVTNAGVAVNIIRPDNYGVDFYGDTLITSELEARDHRERIDAFRTASLRGWKFALDHPQEIIDLLIVKYGVEKSREQLVYEAEETKKLVLSEVVEIGHMNPGRWAKMADTLVSQDLIEPEYSLTGFVYDPLTPKNLLVFLGDKDLAPYQFFENNISTGANIDLLNALGKILGRPVEVRLYQWADAKARLQRGEGHAHTLMIINEKNKEIFDFTQPTFTLEFMMFVKSRHYDRFNIGDLSNQRVAVKPDSFPQRIIEEQHPEAEIVFVDNDLQGFQLLSNGEVDGLIKERLAGHRILEINKFEGIKALPTAMGTQTIHIPVSKGNTALLNDLNEAISTLKSEGEIEAISRRWLAGPVRFITQSEQDAAMIGAAVTLAVVALLSILLFLNVAKRNRERTVAEGQMRASLAEKEVLLREIHHRVKNNLQTISSMLRLQAGTETDRRAVKALQESQRRVMAVARIHESLHQSDDLASINVRDYLKSLIEDTKASCREPARPISFRLDADDTIIDVDHAVVCGQVISELLSNSLKHGFPNGRSGTIDVSLNRSEGGTIEVAVADNGKGLPEDFDLRQSKTLGLKLVQALARQVGGVIDIDGSNGTRVQFTFPEKIS